MKKKAIARIDGMTAWSMRFTEEEHFADTGESPSPQSVADKFWTERGAPPDNSMNESMALKAAKSERRTRDQRAEAKLKVSPIKP